MAFNHNLIRSHINPSSSGLEAAIVGCMDSLKRGRRKASVSWHGLSWDMLSGNRLWEIEENKLLLIFRKQDSDGQGDFQRSHSKGEAPGFKVGSSDSKSHQHATGSLQEEFPPASKWVLNVHIPPHYSICSCLHLCRDCSKPLITS